MAQKRKQIRSTSRILALEPRLLFDGAAVVAAHDVIAADDTHKDAQDSSHASDNAEADSRAQGQLDFDGSHGVTTQAVVLIDFFTLLTYNIVAINQSANNFRKLQDSVNKSSLDKHFFHSFIRRQDP